MTETPIYDEVLEDHIDQASTDQEFNNLDRMDKETRPRRLPDEGH